MFFLQIVPSGVASRRCLLAIMLLLGPLIAGLATPLALAAPAAQGTVPLRVGYLGPAGTSTAQGAWLAIDQINEAGGFAGPDGTKYTLELVPLATALTVDSLGASLNKLLEQEVIAILGPDEDTLLTEANRQILYNMSVPVLTAATADDITNADASNTVFRTRASEYFYSNSLAVYLTEDLGFTSIALVQTDVRWTASLAAFENILKEAGITPISIPLPDGSNLDQAVQQITGGNPEAVVMWGAAEDAAILLQQLRKNGWAGQFAYREAEQAVRDGIMPDALADGMLGVTSWSYADKSQVSRYFLRDYVIAFAQVPDALAASGYDAIWFLREALMAQGPAPDALRAGLLNGSPMALVQGMLHPADFGNGDLTQMTAVYELNKYGGAEVLARFDGTLRLELDISGEAIVQVPTPTPGPPTMTPEPTGSPFPTATLEGAWVLVTATTLNVRTGPGFDYDKIGQVKEGDLLRIISAIPDYSWLIVDFQGGVGWVKTEYVEIMGDLSTVSIVLPPPSPTPAATATPTLPATPDIIVETVVMSPTQPVPNKPFTATVTLKNIGGGAAGQFAVAATFEPGSVYTSAFVNGLAGGQSTQVQLNGTLTGSGVFTVAIVADLNKEVNELNENNNLYNITYRADYPLFANQSGIQLTANTNWDLYGGTNDILWDGYNIAMVSGSVIGVISGTTYENVHYDTLSPSVITNTIGVGTDQVNAGVVFGVYIAEGRRAVIRIDNRQDTTIWISYRVYNND